MHKYIFIYIYIYIYIYVCVCGVRVCLFCACVLSVLESLLKWERDLICRRPLEADIVLQLGLNLDVSTRDLRELRVR